MVGLLDGFGGLFKGTTQPEAEVDEGPSAMELAMQAAIEKYSTEQNALAARKGSEATNEKFMRPREGAAVFGRRVASD